MSAPFREMLDGLDGLADEMPCLVSLRSVSPRETIVPTV